MANLWLSCDVTKFLVAKTITSTSHGSHKAKIILEWLSDNAKKIIMIEIFLTICEVTYCDPKSRGIQSTYERKYIILDIKYLVRGICYMFHFIAILESYCEFKCFIRKFRILFHFFLSWIFYILKYQHSDITVQLDMQLYFSAWKIV